MTALTADVAGTDEALTGAFMTAFLLTGSAEGAEAAVLEGLTAMDGNSMPDETLLLGTMAAALAPKTAGNPARKPPLEIRRGFPPPQHPGHAFFLRPAVGPICGFQCMMRLVPAASSWRAGYQRSPSGIWNRHGSPPAR